MEYIYTRSTWYTVANASEFQENHGEMSTCIVIYAAESFVVIRSLDLVS